MTLEDILGVPTAPLPEEFGDDVWDDDNRCSYSADGTRLLDAENFPAEVTVREGCRILCDGVFAFQDYMAEDRKAGEEIPLDERNSFLEKIHLPSTLTHIGRAVFNECGFLEHITRQALHCGRLTFTEPLTGKSVTVSSELPQEIISLIG